MTSSPEARIVLLTPAAVGERKHIEMLRVQSLLARRLQKYLPELPVRSCLVLDWCTNDCRSDLEELAKSFDHVEWQVPPEHGTQWGIRKSTNYAATAGAAATAATHLLRVIQDTFVYDPAALASLIKAAIGERGDWVAANVHHWPTSSHSGLCSQMGLSCDLDLRYPNGQVLFAPVSTWQTWYVSMPGNINHYFDDIMFGEVLRQRSDGRILDWPSCWCHWHDCDPKTSTRIFDCHQAALENGRNGPSLRSVPATGKVPLAACAIVRNESRYIREWIEFHRLVGVERFYIYDDESSDGTEAVVLAADVGDIVLVRWGIGQGPTPQMSAYQHFIDNYRDQAEWVAFIDIDEYLYSPVGIDVKTLLARYELIPYHGAVFVNWLFFGDNGHDSTPEGLTIERYTRRGFAGNPNSQGKVIARTSLLDSFGPCGPHNVVCRDSGLTVNEHESWVPHCDSSPPSIDLLRINHYFHRSKTEAAEKCDRADRNSPIGHRRSAEEMILHNLNDVPDESILQYLPALRERMHFYTAPQVGDSNARDSSSIHK